MSPVNRNHILIGRLDAMVFSGGLGENSSELRSAVIQRCACLGFDHISETMNMKVCNDKNVICDIGEGVRPTQMLVCRTNEEVCLVIVSTGCALIYVTARNRKTVCLYERFLRALNAL